MIQKKKKLKESIVNFRSSFLEYENVTKIASTILCQVEFQKYVQMSLDVFPRFADCSKDLVDREKKIQKFVGELDRKKWKMKAKNRVFSVLFSCKISSQRAKYRDSLSEFKNNCSNQIFSLFHNIPDDDQFSQIVFLKDFENGDQILKTILNYFSEFPKKRAIFNRIYDNLFKLIQGIDLHNIREISQIQAQFKEIQIQIDSFLSDDSDLDKIRVRKFQEFIRLLRILRTIQDDMKSRNKQIKREKDGLSIQKLDELEKFWMFESYQKLSSLRKGFPKYIKAPTKQSRKVKKMLDRNKKKIQKVIGCFREIKEIEDNSFTNDIQSLSFHINRVSRLRSKIRKDLDDILFLISSFCLDLEKLKSAVSFLDKTKKNLRVLEKKNFEFCELVKSSFE